MTTSNSHLMYNYDMDTKNTKKIILGIDPGSRKMGFGVISIFQNSLTYLDSGVIKIPLEPLDSDELLEPAAQFVDRLGFIYKIIEDMISKYQPHHFAIEDIFVNKNVKSALKLGQARGSAIVAACNSDVPVSEYAARQVKQAVVGKGSADKYQVQQMVRILLNLTYLPKTDEADALAIAICHANTSVIKKYESEQYPSSSNAGMIIRSTRFSRGRFR